MNRSIKRANEDIATAHHEAGHAVFAWLYGIDFDFVTIVPEVVPEGIVAGCVDFSSSRHLRKTKRGWALFENGEDMMSAAGPVAHAIFLGAPFIVDGFPSLFEMSMLFSDGDEPKGEWVGTVSDHPKVWKTYWMMKERDDIWSAIVALAHHLLDVKTVSGADASRLIRQHIPVKWPKRQADAA